MEGTGKFPTSEMHILHIARKIAKWAIIDAVKKDDLDTIEELNKAIDKFIR